jgi:hypothetical protein
LSRQQSLREHASILRYTCITYLVYTSNQKLGILTQRHTSKSWCLRTNLVQCISETYSHSNCIYTIPQYKPTQLTFPKLIFNFLFFFKFFMTSTCFEPESSSSGSRFVYEGMVEYVVHASVYTVSFKTCRIYKKLKLKYEIRKFAFYYFLYCIIILYRTVHKNCLVLIIKQCHIIICVYFRA